MRRSSPAKVWARSSGAPAGERSPGAGAGVHVFGVRHAEPHRGARHVARPDVVADVLFDVGDAVRERQGRRLARLGLRRRRDDAGRRTTVATAAVRLPDRRARMRGPCAHHALRPAAGCASRRPARPSCPGRRVRAAAASGSGYRLVNASGIAPVAVREGGRDDGPPLLRRFVHQGSPASGSVCPSPCSTSSTVSGSHLGRRRAGRGAGAGVGCRRFPLGITGAASVRVLSDAVEDRRRRAASPPAC